MLNKRVKRFMKVAEAISDTSKFPRVQIGAIIVDKNDIISCGINQEKSHPTQMKYNLRSNNIDQAISVRSGIEHPHFLHAEIDAIIKAKLNNLEGTTIFIYRKNAKDDLAMCRPCPSCMEAIKDYGIKEIFYTSESGIKYEVLQ